MGAIHAFRGKGAVSTAWIVAVDLPHSQQHPRPQRCSWKSLSWTQTAKGEIFAMVGMAPFLHPPTRCVVLRLVAVGIHNEFTYLIHGQHTSPFSIRRQITLHFANKQKHSHHLTHQTFNCFQTIICKLVNGKVACPSYSLCAGAAWTQKVLWLKNSTC